MRMPQVSHQTIHVPGRGLPSMTALLTSLIICIGVGFVAAFLFNYFWFATVEPLIYPCPYADIGGLCIYDPNLPEPEQPVLFFS